jgi:hypothetical protein
MEVGGWSLDASDGTTGDLSENRETTEKHLKQREMMMTSA